jgi:hypothetical protein
VPNTLLVAAAISRSRNSTIKRGLVFTLFAVSLAHDVVD